LQRASPAQGPEIPLASRVQACCGVINLTVFACPELQGQLHIARAMRKGETERKRGGPGGFRTHDQTIMSLLVEFQSLKNQTFTRTKLLFLLR
ncbi:hypothetical protein, partial [Ralstonia pseudosolanacearum]|uniref:hypothetical protein n=1 Tax=Ralstonia pseudosolanacearum TaxID=1310165 RepID=UPI001E400A29